MPPSVHKILLHSTEIIENFLIPIGQLSEDAQEARHKEVKRIRECNTGKRSRTHTMEDMVHMLLATSDPFISSLRVLPTKKCQVIDKDVWSLLICELDTEFFQ